MRMSRVQIGNEIETINLSDKKETVYLMPSSSVAVLYSAMINAHYLTDKQSLLPTKSDHARWKYTRRKPLFPTGDYSKSSNGDASNDMSENSSTATCCSQTDGPLSDHDGLSSSTTFTSDKSLPKSQHSSAKPRTRRRRAYNIPLPPVVEHLDEETGDDLR